MSMNKPVKTGLLVGIIYAIIAIIGAIIGIALLSFLQTGLGIIVLMLAIIGIFVVGFVEGVIFWYVTDFLSRLLLKGKYPSIINGLLFAGLSLASLDLPTIIIAFLTGALSYKVANMKIGK